MTNPVFIRPATNQDLPQIYRIRKAVIPPEEGELSEEAVRDLFTSLDGKEGYWMVEHAGETVGWGMIHRYSPRGGYRFCAELEICLTPDVYHDALGRSLLESLIDQCRHWKYHHLLARIWGDNDSGLTLFRNAGFEEVGIQKEIGCRKGEWVDMVVFQMVLPVADH